MDNKINITHIIINIKIFELSILINNKNLNLFWLQKIYIVLKKWDMQISKEKYLIITT